MFNMVNKARKNNKGFSLVELIVVILIIAILAVALAPQVVKYVNQARINNDANNAANIKSSVQTAYADYLANGGTKYTGSADLKVVEPDSSKTDGSTKISDLSSKTDYSDLEDYVDEVMGSDIASLKTQSTKNGFTATISSSGAVTVSY